MSPTFTSDGCEITFPDNFIFVMLPLALLTLGGTIIVILLGKKFFKGKCSIIETEGIPPILAVKDLIHGIWTLSPDRIIYNRLEIQGAYKNRAVKFGCYYDVDDSFRWSGFYCDDKYFYFRVICDTSFLSKSPSSAYLFFYPDSLEARIKIRRFKGKSFFTSVRIKELLEKLMEVVKFVENGRIDIAVDVWERARKN